jgi:hypothetical protein
MDRNPNQSWIGTPPLPWPERRYKVEQNGDGTANILRRTATGAYEVIDSARQATTAAWYVTAMNTGLQPWD